MRLHTRLTLTAAAACHILATHAIDVDADNAAQWPISSPGNVDTHASALFPATTSATRRVAVIGAGAGGSSAAFWIGKAKERYGLDVEVDVYERSDYVGGRSTTVQPYDDETLQPIEVGASIYVRINKNMWRATDEFGLNRTGFGEESGDVGIWDGSEFVFILREGGWFASWWQTAKVLWRYGFTAPTRAKSLVSDMTTSFVKLYTRSTPRWTSIEELSTAFGWNTLISTTTADYFVKEKGVSKMFTEEMVQASTRVNYAQDIGEIHALEGAASMASGEASSVKGGNWQVFEQFAKRSGAKVLLNTKVKSISRKEHKAEGQTDQANDVNSRRAARWTVETSLGNTASYDAVILAAPYHQTGISIRSPALSDDAAILAKVPLQPYVHLHVTLLSTKAPTPRPSYFGWADEKTDVPTMVLTTPAQNGQQPEFNSLSYHGLLKYRNGTERVDTEKEWVVKIFSMKPISDEWLKDVFRGQVGWVHRKEWDAYPRLPPTATFPAVKLDKGLYYVNAFEPFISTMETETIAARNVVDLLLEEHFGCGICGPRVTSNTSASEGVDADKSNEEKFEEKLQKKVEEAISESKSKVKAEDFVYGWDC